MYEIKATIQGVAPVLFNRFTEAQKDAMEKRQTGGIHTAESSMKEALTKVYRNGDGLYMPAQNIKKSLLNGIKKGNIKEGKASFASIAEATVFIQPAEILFGKQEPDYIHESTGRIPPRTGARCVIRRPALKEGWELSFTIMLIDDRRDPAKLKAGLEEAGALVGLCDWRPEFGRFIVTQWDVKQKK